jgi:hypothetical protein
MQQQDYKAAIIRKNIQFDSGKTCTVKLIV